MLLFGGVSYAQQDTAPGHSIGNVSTEGDLIVMELADGALGKPNLFDLSGRTLRFRPEGPRYRANRLANRRQFSNDSVREERPADTKEIATWSAT